MSKPRRDYLVFTSAGSNANLHLWVKEPDRCFDLCVVNYSDEAGLHQKHADIYVESRGSKFANLYKVYHQNPELIAAYKAIWVADDDVIISTSAINQLFLLHHQHRLTLLQPAFCIRGKISHPITKRKLFSGIRYTNFVEMTCPLVERDFLMRFLKIYDPVLVGFGIDWWMLNLLRPNEQVAISDEICCVNPYDRAKKNATREISRLQSDEERIATWQFIKHKYGLQQFEQRVLRHECRTPSALLAALPGYCYDFLVGYSIRLIQKTQLIKGL